MRSIFTFLILILVSCNQQSSTVGYQPTPESIEREKLADQIIAKVATKLRKGKHLIPSGCGGRTSNGVQRLYLSFDYRIPVDIDEGRELLIECVREFYTAVNEEPRIQRYLNDRPFGPKNISVDIFLQKADGSELPGSLRVISADEGLLEYTIKDPNNKWDSITLLEETFEEALQKIEDQKLERVPI